MRRPANMDESGSVTLEILTGEMLGRQGRTDAGEFFRSTLPRLRDEFERRLVVVRSSPPEDRALPRFLIEQELVVAGTYPSHSLLRLVIGKALALKELTASLVAEGESELRRRGLRFECWQEGLLR